MNLKLRLDKYSYFYFSCTSSSKSIIRTKAKGYLHFDKRIYDQGKEENVRSQGKPKMMFLEKVKGRRREYYSKRREIFFQKINNEIEREGRKISWEYFMRDSYFVSLKIRRFCDLVNRNCHQKVQTIWIDKDKNMRIWRKLKIMLNL